jgi:hypothetical protein
LATWRYDPSERLADADRYLSKAKYIFDTTPNLTKENTIFNGDCYWNLSKMIISYLNDDVKLAREYFVVAEKLDSEGTKGYVNKNWINQIMIRALD